MEEIHRCRVDRIARLLLETNMTIGEIAAASEFEVDAHLARFFSRQIGMTPLAYLKKYRIPESLVEAGFDSAADEGNRGSNDDYEGARRRS